MTTIPDHLEFAVSALQAYSLPDGARPRMVSLSENATFLVESQAGPVGVLRIYRPDYQTTQAMASELEWIAELGNWPHVRTPALIPTRDGRQLHSVEVDGHIRSCTMFEFIPGSELAGDDMASFAVVGSIAATLHKQIEQWQRPESFERFTWDLERILDDGARWGNWRNGPGHTTAGIELLERAELVVRAKLGSYPQVADNSGLVHGDLRSANVMQDTDGNLWVIDFDDAGFSWLLWDLCSTTTFIEHLPHVSSVVDAWLDGYQKVRKLRSEDLAVIPDLVFLRRLHVLAWLGSHPQSDLAASLGDSYTEATYEVAGKYLAGDFLSDAKDLAP